MDDIETRLAGLEATRAVQNKIAAEQLLRLREIEENMTILVGVQGSQGLDIKAIKDRLERVEERMTTEFASIQQQLATIAARLAKPVNFGIKWAESCEFCG